MTRLASWRAHAACRKEIIALKKRLAKAERALLNARKAAHAASAEWKKPAWLSCPSCGKWGTPEWHRALPGRVCRLAALYRAIKALDRATQ